MGRSARRTALRYAVLATLMPLWAGAAPAADAAPLLQGKGAYLPGLLESSTSGPYAALMRLLEAQAPASTIRFSVTPVARAMRDVSLGSTDFAFPMMRIRAGADDGMPYRFSTESVGRVTFVLYSNRAKPLTREAVLAAAQAGKPYVIEAPPVDWGFPTAQLIQVEAALKKLNRGRIDGFLWAQEEADQVVRRLQLNQIQRTHFDDYDEVVLLPRTARGELADSVFSSAIRAARKSGRLASLYAQIHRAYDNWQPGRP